MVSVLDSDFLQVTVRQQKESHQVDLEEKKNGNFLEINQKTR